MAWYTVPNNGLAGRFARFIGMRREGGDAVTVAVDGMHELRSEYRDEGPRSFFDFDRTTWDEMHVGRFRTDADAIAAWREMLREGEL